MKREPDSLGHWFSELRDRGQAPDHHAAISFSYTPDMDVRKLIRDLKLKNFRIYEKDKDRDQYIGSGDFDAYTKKTKTHFSQGNFISVEDGTVVFTRVGGGSSMRDYADDEMKIFHCLLTNENIRIDSWVIENGGDGLKGDMKREGTTKKQLLDYLKAIS